MFPIRDENPQINIPYVTYALIALNVFAWFVLQGFGQEPALSRSVCSFGLIPADLRGLELAATPGFCPVDGRPEWSTTISSMFMHGSWMHIIGNMWFLWIFGNNVEDSMGPSRFLAFYLLCGLVAAATQVIFDANSAIPMVGASGAIGGVMGAYIVLYPRVHVHLFIFLGIIFYTFAVPAIMMLGYWIVVQLIGGFSSIGSDEGGVAFWAHVGGFVAGAALVLLFKDEKLLAGHPYRGWTQKEHADAAWKQIREKRGSWH
jgi:membrane associated rhomboid family serine protease